MDTNLNNPLISVIMPVYNAQKYLGQAIESVLRQTYRNFELIIIDYGSSDDSLKIIKSFSDSRIKIVYHKKNQGIISSLNDGIKESAGKYIARMDADDISLPKRLEKQISFLENNPLVVMCGTWARVINESGKVVDKNIHPPTDGKSIRSYILKHNPFIHPTVMMKKSAFKDSDWYRNKFKHAEDYELWTRIVFLNEVANIPEELLEYRMTKSGITSKNRFFMRIMGFKIRILAVVRKIRAKLFKK